jgi:hypothetical protein
MIKIRVGIKSSLNSSFHAYIAIFALLSLVMSFFFLTLNHSNVSVMIIWGNLLISACLLINSGAFMRQSITDKLQGSKASLDTPQSANFSTNTQKPSALAPGTQALAPGTQET